MSIQELYLKIQIDVSSVNQRLDVFLKTAAPDISRTRWQDWIRQGYVSLDHRTITDPNFRLSTETLCTVKALPEAKEWHIEPVAMDFHIYYEDQDLLVLEKPYNLVMHPGAGSPQPSLVQGLMAHSATWSGIGGVERPGLVHRLDKDTSGLLVVAKNDYAHQHLSEQFAQRKVEKFYTAFVRGIPEPYFGTWEGLMGRDPKARLKQSVLYGRGKLAKTSYRVLCHNHKHSMLECQIHTGRTHQIRVHCSAAGHSLLGDSLYGDGLGHSRVALHASRLGFFHPRTQSFCSFISPLPPDLHELQSRFELIPIS